MGLFDIFKKKAPKEEVPESTQESTQVESQNVPVPSQSIEESQADEMQTSLSTEVEHSVSEVQSESITNSNLVTQSETPELSNKESQSEVTANVVLDSEVTSSTMDTIETEQKDESVEDSTTIPDEDEETPTEEKYDQGLEKSRSGFGARLNALLANFRHVDEDFFDELEETLIESDVGFDMAVSLSDDLRQEVKLENAKTKQDVSNVIIQKLVEIYESQGAEEETNQLNFAESGPTVFLFVGVNGVGKTTTIGKMANKYQKMGKKVLLAAADTFRAGATEQLQVWGKRANVPVVAGPVNGDPASVVFDAVTKAKSENYDILFVDTAGRLQNKVNLMNELAKMKKIITREIPEAPHEVLLVLDATTGQNALTQAKMFKDSTEVTGIVLTKLDGTARGGIVLAIRNELHIPVKLVGLGEGANDLQEFDASQFVYGLFKGLVTTK